MNIRVLLADVHKIMREGLRALVEKERGMEVVGEAENGRTAVQLARKLSPNIVLMDCGMPDLNGMEATREIVATVPDVRVIGLSMHSDKRFVREMLKAGASGYLVKDCPFEEVREAIRAVAAGGTYLGGLIGRVVLGDYVQRLLWADSSAFSALTPREREVVQLLAEGKSTKQIASVLHVSVKTIETHRRRIMDKLGIESVAELTKYAIREGLTDLEA